MAAHGRSPTMLGTGRSEVTPPPAKAFQGVLNERGELCLRLLHDIAHFHDKAGGKGKVNDVMDYLDPQTGQGAQPLSCQIS